MRKVGKEKVKKRKMKDIIKRGGGEERKDEVEE